MCDFTIVWLLMDARPQQDGWVGGSCTFFCAFTGAASSTYNVFSLTVAGIPAGMRMSLCGEGLTNQWPTFDDNKGRLTYRHEM